MEENVARPVLGYTKLYETKKKRNSNREPNLYRQIKKETRASRDQKSTLISCEEDAIILYQ